MWHYVISGIYTNQMHWYIRHFRLSYYSLSLFTNIWSCERSPRFDYHSKILKSNGVPPSDPTAGRDISGEGEGVASLRQTGQVEWEKSHISMHCTWNECKHSGRVRSSSPSSNSLRQTEQTTSSSTNPSPFSYLCAGMSSATDISALLIGKPCRCLWENRDESRRYRPLTVWRL